jgi:hypothetical protein
MTTDAAALVISVALIFGWHAAKFVRAMKDLDGAKAGVERAKRTLGVERRPFLVIGVIAFFIIWWWINKHTR